MVDTSPKSIPAKMSLPPLEGGFEKDFAPFEGGFPGEVGKVLVDMCTKVVVV